MTTNSKLKKNAGILSLLSILTYLLEFARNILIAAVFGVNRNMDALYAAKSLPDLIAALLGGAAYNTVLSTYPSDNDCVARFKKNTIFWTALLLIGSIMLLLSSVGALYANSIIGFFFQGLDNSASEIGSQLLSIFSIVAFFTVVINILRSYYDHSYNFFLPGLLFLLIPLSSLGTILLFAQEIGVISIAFGLLVGSVIASGILLTYLLHHWQFRLSELRVDMDAGKQMMLLLIPVAFGSIAYQLNTVVDRMFASTLADGSITALHYGYTILNIPHAFISVPIATALFPAFSRFVKDGNVDALKYMVARTLRMLFLVTAWSLWIMLAFSQEIVSVIYKRGVFDSTAVSMTATALSFYSIGFGVFAANSILIRVLMAYQYKDILYLVGLWSVVVNVLGNWLLSRWFGYAGIAMSTSIVHISWFLVAYFLLKRRTGYFLNREDVFFITKVFFISMFTTLFSHILTRQFPSNTSAHMILVLGVAGSGISYIILLYIFKVKEFRDALTTLRTYWHRLLLFRTGERN